MNNVKRITVETLHEAIDDLWRLGIVSRSAAYAMLCAHLGVDEDSGVHTGRMTECERTKVLEFINTFRRSYLVAVKRYPASQRDPKAPLVATLGERLLRKD